MISRHRDTKAHAVHDGGRQVSYRATCVRPQMFGGVTREGRSTHSASVFDTVATRSRDWRRRIGNYVPRRSPRTPSSRRRSECVDRLHHEGIPGLDMVRQSAPLRIEISSGRAELPRVLHSGECQIGIMPATSSQGSVGVVSRPDIDL